MDVKEQHQRRAVGFWHSVCLPHPAFGPDEYVDATDRAQPVGVAIMRVEGVQVPLPQAPCLPPLRVLVVEDCMDTARSLGLLLEQCGYEVHIAHDGPTALGLVREHPVDVVLLDIGLPVMSGVEVASRIKAVGPLPIFVMTGYARESDAPSDFDEYLLKPVDPDSLLGLLACLKPSSGGV